MAFFSSLTKTDFVMGHAYTFRLKGPGHEPRMAMYPRIAATGHRSVPVLSTTISAPLKISLA